jgi:hypothetical protein
MTVGRPKKFAEPSSPVTVTLPHRILHQLKALNSDRGKAIVKCVEAFPEIALDDKKRVEVVKLSEKAGLIVIGPCKYLANIPWLRLIEITPSRYLLSIPTGTDVASLEVALIDLIENLPADEYSDKSMLEELRQCISHYRRKEELTKGEILFVAI